MNCQATYYEALGAATLCERRRSPAARRSGRSVLGRNVAGDIVPISYEDDMHELLAAREGLGWRTACEWCGLEVPDESKVARALRGQLRDL